MYTNILIPTDGSALSKKAVKAGVAFARSIGASVTGLYSPERYEVLTYGEYFPPDLISRKQWEKRSEESAKKILTDVEKAAKASGVAYRGYHLASLAPWEAIVETAIIANASITQATNLYENAVAVKEYEEQGIEMLDTPDEYYQLFIDAQNEVVQDYINDDEFFARVYKSQADFAELVYPYPSRVQKLYGAVVNGAEKVRAAKK